MKTLTVALPGREYDILIERGLLCQTGAHLRAVLPGCGKIALVSDSHVASLYADTVERSLQAAGFEVRLFTVPAGEGSKCVSRLAELWDGFLEFGLTRSDGVVALGGGVVGDLAGFAAATVLRGVSFVQIPTTLLAQVDSSVGGKVAIDLKAGKILAGAFHQPRLVLMDPDVLDTLPDADFADGMAEVIKYGCIADEEFLRFLKSHPSREQIAAHIEGVLYTCCRIKGETVVEDERDTGKRMLLNFGHTLGHAYELAGNYETCTHGQAVAAGMVRAAEIGVGLGVTPPYLADLIRQLTGSFGLPSSLSCRKEDYAAAIGLDKKGTGEKISLILLDKPGHAMAYQIKKSELLQLI